MLKALVPTVLAGVVTGGVAVAMAGAPAAAHESARYSGQYSGQRFGQRPRVPECPHTIPGGTQRLTCSCLGTGSSGRAWGTDIYTADSEICMAAQHAQAIDRDGVTTVFSVPGRPAYRGSVRNDVETADWGSFTRSIAFAPSDRPERPAQPVGLSPARAPECPHLMPSGTRSLTCNCLTSGASGRAWGTDIYTADSEICMAAQHAGALAPNGDVTLVSAPGRRAYRGSLRNDVQTAGWGQFTRSIVFRRQP